MFLLVVSMLLCDCLDPTEVDAPIREKGTNQDIVWGMGVQNEEKIGSHINFSTYMLMTHSFLKIVNVPGQCTKNEYFYCSYSLRHHNCCNTAGGNILFALLGGGVGDQWIPSSLSPPPVSKTRSHRV